MKALFVREFEGQKIAFGRGGWFNASQASARYGKDVSSWLSSPAVSGYINRLAAHSGSKRTGYVSKSRQREHGGYWLHPDLAGMVGRWLGEDISEWLDSEIQAVQKVGREICRSSLLDRDWLNECFLYDDETGLLIWRADRPASHFSSPARYQSWIKDTAGTIAGYPSSDGYLLIKIEGTRLYQHHIVLAMHGIKVPYDKEVDHLNGNRSDNRMQNLRVVSHLVNMRNRTMHSNNTSGINGVSRIGGSRPWMAQAGLNGGTIIIGRYHTSEEAEAARQAWQDKVGDFTKRHGKKSCDIAASMV
ncbi:HNH endonuclease [Modicisalibacter coralii]|uniref:HNH endonuclease n=1 Tax=Modicisalibacter coralii TaxID=2304602 RepID=UPI0013967D76|nr:HNH endonuclease [Halomonas coralii]